AQKGDTIEVTVLEIDKANRRLSLGHKQLQENPWDVFESLFTVGSVQEGVITEAVDKGYIVSLAHGVEGFAPAKQVAKEDGTPVAIGDKLDFTVIEFVKATKRITLSHNVDAPVREESASKAKAERKAAPSNNNSNNSNNNSEKDNTQKAVKRINSSNEKATLGDISGLAELKAQLEENGK
ncbi:MAG: S1 RNA-binding domain-containing protein, partial [Rikenellaceae bacterium]